MFASLNALTFMGGGFAIALFCAPFLWRKQVLSLLALSAGLFMALAIAGGMMAKNYEWITGGIRLGAETQIFFWTVSGLCVLALAVADVWQKRDVLPMAPAVGILIARRLEQKSSALPAGIKVALVVSAILSMMAAQADFHQASTARKCTEQVCAKYTTASGRLWFEGHWGFQYYMQSFGAWPLDFNHSEIKSGDILIIPGQNSNVVAPDPQTTTLLEVYKKPLFPWFATWSSKVGASFYSTGGGPLPFAFGPIPAEKVFVYLWR